MMANLEISLLGTMQMTYDGTSVAAPAYAKMYGLLAYLAIEDDRPHQRASLAALFWPEQPEERARHSLRQALSSLRRTTASAGADPCLVTTRDAVAFDRDAGHVVDVQRFRQLLRESERHRHARLDRCGPCARRLEEATALYRGDFLAGFSIDDSAEFDDWAAAWRERLRDQATQALASLAAFHDQLGDLDRARDSVQRLLELDAWNEPAHRHLMELWWQEGNRAAAIAQFERCRAVLDEELGVEPEAETIALCDRIRARDAGDPVPRPKRGERRQRSRQLPSPTTALIGRQREMEEIADLLANEECRLVTLVGPGGSGKTRLATEIANEQAHHLAETAVFVPLAAVRNAPGISHAIADELGLALSGSAQIEHDLIGWMRDRSVFLVLDNLEQLVEEARVVSTMLREVPDLTILATCRERLHLRGEWVYELGGLPVPHGDASDSFEGYGAVELLNDRLRQVRSGTPLQPEERPAVVRICRLVDGMPLALEMAAGWAPTLTLEQIADGIQRSIDFLASALRDLPERHRSMRAVLFQTWELLSDEERAAWRYLSVFVDGFELDAADSIAGTSPTRLAQLIDKSLVIRSPHGRHRLHELLRQYGEELLQRDPHEHRELHDRHCRYYLGLLGGLETALTGGDQSAAMATIERDHENMRWAWSWAVEHGMFAEIGEAAHALWLYYVIRGWMREGVTIFGDELAMLEASRERGVPETPEMRTAWATALMYTGGFRSGLGGYDDGIAMLEHAISLFRQMELRREQALALNMLAAAYSMKGELLAARDLLEQSLGLFRSIDDAWGSAFSLNDRGLIAHLLDEEIEAERYCEESRVMFRQVGDRRGHAFTAYNLGMIAAGRGDYVRARRLYEESLSLREHTHDQWGIAASLVRLGSVVRELDALEEARGHLVKALQISYDASVVPVLLAALLELAVIEVDAGNEPEASHMLAAICRHPALTGDQHQRVDSLMHALSMESPADVLAAGHDQWAVQAVDDIARKLVV